MAKWLDKYDAPQAQNGIEGTMGGLTDKGFNYNGAWGGPSMQYGGSLENIVTPYSRENIDKLRREWVKHYNKPAPYALSRDDRFDDFYYGKVETLPKHYNKVSGWIKNHDTDMQEFVEGDKNTPPKEFGKPLKGYEYIDEYMQGPYADKSQEMELARLVRSIRNVEYEKPEWARDVRYNTRFQTGGIIQPPMAGANTSVSMAQLGDSVKPIPMQLAMGGSLPGAVGFTYARTAGAAPANGPYAKKTKASAQDGEKVMKGREFVEKWMNSPMYKQMLEKSAQGPELERINTGRIRNLSIPTNVSTDISLHGTGTLGQKQHRIRTMFNATVPERDEMIKTLQAAVDNPKDKEARRRAEEVMQPVVTGWDIGMNPILKPGTLDYEATLAHEYGHTTDDPFVSKLPHQMSKKELMSHDVSSYIPKSDIEKMQSYYQGKVNDDFTKYVSKPQETRQYLTSLRYLGKTQGVYDPFTEKITPEQYKRIKPTEFNDPAGTLRNIYTDEQIIDMLNSISRTQRANGVPVAQNGQEMKYYQEGLDFKPKTISQNGSRTPIYVSDPKDPRLKAYQDSLSAYNDMRKYFDMSRGYPRYKNEIKGWDVPVFHTVSDEINYYRKHPQHGWAHFDVNDFIQRTFGATENVLPEKLVNWVPRKGVELARKDLEAYNQLGLRIPVYKKPVQPVVLEEEPRFEKPIPIPRKTIDLGYELPVPGAFRPIETSQFENKPTKYTFTYPTGKYNEQKTMYFPSKSALKSFVGGVRGATYQEGADYASATGTLQDGGDIPVDSMGYWNPENWGNPVIIPSTDITMEGVDQPLLGISDTGDVQYMEPGEDYEFDGEYVTEYPVAQKGTKVPAATTADSLRVYNNAMMLKRFYDKLTPYYGSISTLPFDDRGIHKKELETGKIQKETLQHRSVTEKNKAIIRANKDPNIQYISDLVTGAIDPAAPLAIYDRRISPTSLITYQPPNIGSHFPKEVIRDDNKHRALALYLQGGADPTETRIAKNVIRAYRLNEQELIKKAKDIAEKQKHLPGYITTIPYYEPLAVKPYHMRTPEEKITWERKYGKKEKPAPPSEKKKVMTPTPEPVKETKALAPEPIRQTAPSFTPPIVPSGSVSVFGPGRSRIGEYDEKTNTFYPDYGNLAARSKANQADTDLISDEEELAAYVASRTGKKPKIDITLVKQRNGGVNNADAQPLKKLDQLLNFTNYNKPTKGGWLDKYN